MKSKDISVDLIESMMKVVRVHLLKPKRSSMRNVPMYSKGNVYIWAAIVPAARKTRSRSRALSHNKPHTESAQPRNPDASKAMNMTVSTALDHRPKRRLV